MTATTCRLGLLLVALAALSACRGAAAPVPRIERVVPAAPTAAESTSPRPPVAGAAAEHERTPAAPAPSATATVSPRSPVATATRIPTARPTPRATRTPAPERTRTPSPSASSEGYGDAGLVEVILDALGAQAAHAGVVARRLSDGATASWGAETVFYAASLYKLAVLYEAFRQQQQGLLDFSERVPVTEKYRDEDLGTMGRLPLTDEGEIAVGDAVAAMITYSDNTSAALLLDLLGHRTIDATMRGLGLTSSSVNTTELPTTATDMARLMEAIVHGERLDAEAASAMTALLLGQEHRYGIPRGVPAGVVTGNKWGSYDGYVHDVAVVYAPRGTYVLAVLTTSDWETIARVSRAVYRYWNP